jgi:TP901 family phage tail tape measure protein
MGLGTEVASLFATLGIDDSGFNKGLNSADTKMKTFGNSMSDVKSKWSDFGRAAQVAAIPIGLALGKGIMDASEFDSALGEISARTGVVGDDLDAVAKHALQMGKDTQFSATDAANGMLELLASGDTLEQAMARIADVSTLSAVGNISLKESADGVTDVMAAMRLEVGQTSGVVDILSRATSSSSATVSDMLAAMSSGGNTAANFGINVKDTAAIMAVLAENSIKGSEAGTALRSMLLNMTRPTETVQGAWQELGTSMFDANGEARDFNTVLLEIDASLSSKSAEDQNRILKDLAGSYGFTAISALLATDGLDDMSDAMASQRSATEIAAAKLDTFEGQVGLLQSSIQNLNIMAFRPFMDDVLKPIVGDFTDVINEVADLAEANPELSKTIITVGAGFVAAVAGVSAFGVAASLVTTGVGALIATALSPLGVAIAAGAALIIAYETDFLGFKTTVDTVVRPAIIRLADDFTDLLSNAETTANFIAQGLAAGKFTWRDVGEATVNAVVNEIGNTVLKPPEGSGLDSQRTLTADYSKPHQQQSGATVLTQSGNQNPGISVGAINVNTNGNGTQIARDIKRELIRTGTRNY